VNRPKGLLPGSIFYAVRVPPERKTRANGRASREAIMQAAVDVFAERGYRGASLAEIASRVGMTQPGLLHHFPTKDELLLAVVNEREAENDRGLRDLMARGEPLLPQAIEVIAALNRRVPLQQRLFTTLSAEAIPTNHPLHDYFVERYRRYSAQLADELRAGQDRGEIRADLDAKAVACEVIATLDGLHLQWLLDPERVDLSETLKAYSKRLIAELSPLARPAGRLRARAHSRKAEIRPDSTNRR
jgi:AcrR family transcriptional regulator